LSHPKGGESLAAFLAYKPALSAAGYLPPGLDALFKTALELPADKE